MSVPGSQAPADKHELAVRRAIAVLLQGANVSTQALQRAKLSPAPVDLTPVVIASLAEIMRSMAFLLDESLAASGLSHEIQFKQVERGNGNGQDGPPRLVMP